MLLDADVDTPLLLEAAVLGLPVVFETNSPEVLEVARAAYDRGGVGRRVPLRVRIVVDPTLRGDGVVSPVVSLPRHDRLELRVGGGRAIAEAQQGTAHALLSPATIEAVGFREAVLDHLTLFLATHWDRLPLHAAGVVREGRALLLAGPSGLGKSSLTYAAMTEGFEILADDAIYVQRDPQLRLWSMARRIHLPTAVTGYFPELSHLQAVLRPDRRRKLSLEIPPDARARVPWRGPVGLCILAPGSASSKDERPKVLSQEAAVVEMRATLQGGFRRFSAALDACVLELAAGGCWRFPVNVEPALLVQRLGDLFRALPDPRAP